MRSWSGASTGSYRMLLANRPNVSQLVKEPGEHQYGLLAPIIIDI